MGHDTHWWESEERDVAGRMTSTARAVWEDDSWRRDEINKNLRRFNQRGLRGLFLGDGLNPDRNNVRVNISKASVETLTAKVGTARPRPKFLTQGGDWSTRRRVKKLQRFTDQATRAAKVHDVGKHVFRDAMIGGTGIMAFVPDVGRKMVRAERVFPPEVVVDEAEAVDGNPQNMFRSKFLDRSVLSTSFPKKKGDLAAVPKADMTEGGDDAVTQAATSTRHDMVQVWEAWHLATYDGNGDLVPGRHVVAAGDVLLVDEEYEYDYFPFAFFHWSDPVRGFWGDSALSEIRGLEKSCNTMLQKIDRAMRLTGQPWVLSHINAKVPDAKFTDQTALIIPWQGQIKPEVVAHQPIHPQVIQQAWTLQSKAFEQLGLTELQVAGARPPGIESGRALEQLSEEHLVRFKDVAQRYEQLMAMDVSRHFLRCAQELDDALKARGKKGYQVRAKYGKYSADIDWAEAKVAPDDLTIEVWPTSALPLTPAGRTQEVERWQTNGWITPQRAMVLLEFPDLDSESDLASADVELVEWQLEQMLEDGKDVTPLDVQNLEYARQRVIYAIERATQDGCPLDHIDKANTYLEVLQSFLPAPAAPALQTMGGPTPVPGVVGPAPNPLQMPPAGGGMPAVPGVM